MLPGCYTGRIRAWQSERMETAMLPTIPSLAFLLLVSGIATMAAETLRVGDFTAPNPRIDFTTFLAQAQTVNEVRERHRLSEARFIELAQQPGVAILDARSSDKFALLHVAGAINLPYTDFSEPQLAKTLPDKKQLILIYCNNNFAEAPRAFESKLAPASLNIATFIALHTYGYECVFELGPLLDVRTTKIPLLGERK